MTKNQAVSSDFTKQSLEVNINQSIYDVLLNEYVSYW